MSFISLLKSNVKVCNDLPEKIVQKEVITESEETKKPDSLLRSAGFKIKLINGTSFGTEIVFAKQYDEEKIKDVLKGFNLKFKDKSVFIIDWYK